MQTGEVARQADVNKQTLRYYERRGLLPEPPRDANGHRAYGPDAVRRLRFIKRAQELGFTLDTIDELLSLRARSGAPNRLVKRKTKQQLDETRRRIADLQRIAGTLEDLCEACDGKGTTGECPILDALDDAEDAPDAS